MSVPAGTLAGFLKRNYLRAINIVKYCLTFGRIPNITSPSRISEKILVKILFDRDPHLTFTTDKILVRDFVKAALGTEENLIPLYGMVRTPQAISHLNLPNSFVMKPNHLTGEVLIVKNLKETSINELEKLAKKWFYMEQYTFNNAWAYKNIEPVVLFEKLLEVDNDIPDDYKFFCLEGKPRFIQVDRDRFKGHRRNIYDMNFSLLSVKWCHDNFKEELLPPPNLDKMIDICRKLSACMKFVRVDLYNVNGRIYFGEITHYPGGGLEKFEPDDWDEKLGKD